MISKRNFLIAGALSTALVFGQGQRMRGPGEDADPATRVEMRVNFLATLLGLTDEQKSRATAIYTEATSASEANRTSLQTTMESLAAAVKSNNTAAIDQLSLTAGTLNGQLMAVERKADAAFYAILTAEQKEKFDTMPRGGPGGRGPMGPAGFGRSGRGPAPQ